MPVSTLVEQRATIGVASLRQPMADLVPEASRRIRLAMAADTCTLRSMVACRELVRVQKASAPMSNSERNEARGANEKARKRSWAFVNQENFWICVLLPVLLGMLLLWD